MPSPQEAVAQLYMARKGMPDVQPRRIDQQAQYRWLFVYDLVEGILELRVEWSQRTGWVVETEDFYLPE